MIKKILARNIWLYLAVMLIMAAGIDWNACFMQRGKYLLGIFYNGFFQNADDGTVYQDYLKRHGYDHQAFVKVMPR